MRTFRYSLAATALLACGLLACALSLRLSHRAFTGYDVSPLIDCGWRVFSGQTPGRDFIVTFPPSLYLTIALSFKLFGVTWQAIALGDVVLYLAFLILGLRVGALLQSAWSTRAAILCAASYTVGQTILLISINYPWHASMAQSFALYAFLASLALLGAHPASHPRSVEAFLHLLLAVTLLLLSKPNTAYPAIAACLAILLLAHLPRRILLLIPLVALLLASLALHRVHTNLWQMFHSYLGLTERMRPRGFLLGITGELIPHYALVNLLVYAILAPLLTTLTLVLWRHRVGLARKPLYLLALAALIVSLCGMGTNFDFKLTDSPLILLAGTIPIACAPEASHRPLPFRLHLTSLALLTLALYMGRARYRMLWAEPACPLQTSISDPFLGSIRVCSTLSSTLTDVDRLLATHRRSSIFLGPALEFLYAGRRLPSPPHLPNWWDIGTSFPKKDSERVSAAWTDDRFDLLILPEPENRMFLPPQISQAIDRDFVLLPGTTSIHAYRRR